MYLANPFRKGLQHLLTIILAVSLVGCGGSGGSSSGGGSSASGPIVLYLGTETLVFSSPDLPSVPGDSGTFALRIEVQGSEVRVTDVDGVVYKGSLSGSDFAAYGRVDNFTESGISCKAFTVQYKGTINGAAITGTVSGNTTCSSAGIQIRLVVKGTFKASRSAREFIASGDKRGMIGGLLAR